MLIPLCLFDARGALFPPFNLPSAFPLTRLVHHWRTLQVLGKRQAQLPNEVWMSGGAAVPFFVCWGPNSWRFAWSRGDPGPSISHPRPRCIPRKPFLSISHRVLGVKDDQVREGLQSPRCQVAVLFGAAETEDRKYNIKQKTN